MLGICGTGMGSLAGLLKAKGYTVTGSDQAIYPPMSTQLKQLGIEPCQGFDPKNLEPRPDLVIVGNVIRKENPEAMAVLEEQIPYLSMPQAISQLFLQDNDSIVVTGTHGKTTTANIVAWLLESLDQDPSFMIGGVGLNFGKSFRSADGKYFVIEGDEYDTAFFDKESKFLHYCPQYAIISSIEFDHADIFKNLSQIKKSFAKFIELIPADGICVINADDKEVADIAHHAHCRITTYGFSDNADYRIKMGKIDRNGTHFTISDGGKEADFIVPLAGRHNVLNATAAIVLLLKMGFDVKALGDGLKGFKGVRRRQEERGIVDSVTVIDDFAHHPTAIRETVHAVKEKYAPSRIWAIFEPRSNTTRRKIFEKDLSSSFTSADKVIIANIFHSENIPECERLDPEKVVSEINRDGGDSYYIDNTDGIVDFIIKNIQPNDVILVMSNGAFDNIHEKIIDGLKKLRNNG